MLTLAAAKRVAGRLLTGPVQDLNAINAQLGHKNLPDYYLGEAGFNIDYRIANKPRYVGRWWPPGLVMSQFYLYHLPSIPDGREPTLDDEIVLRLR